MRVWCYCFLVLRTILQLRAQTTSQARPARLRHQNANGFHPVFLVLTAHKSIARHLQHNPRLTAPRRQTNPVAATRAFGNMAASLQTPAINTVATAIAMTIRTSSAAQIHRAHTSVTTTCRTTFTATLLVSFSNGTYYLKSIHLFLTIGQVPTCKNLPSKRDCNTFSNNCTWVDAANFCNTIGTPIPCSVYSMGACPNSTCVYDIYAEVCRDPCRNISISVTKN